MIKHSVTPGNEPRFTAVGSLEAVLKARRDLLASLENEMIRISRGLENARADIAEIETAIAKLMPANV